MTGYTITLKLPDGSSHTMEVRTSRIAFFVGLSSEELAVAAAGLGDASVINLPPNTPFTVETKNIPAYTGYCSTDELDALTLLEQDPISGHVAALDGRPSRRELFASLTRKGLALYLAPNAKTCGYYTITNKGKEVLKRRR